MFGRHRLSIQSLGMCRRSRVELRVVLGDFFSLVWPLIPLPTTTWPRTRCSTVQYTRQTAPPRLFCHIGSTVANSPQPWQFNCPLRTSKRKVHYWHPCATALRPTIVPKNAKDRIFVTDILPYLVVRGVSLSGVVVRHALWAAPPGPPGSFTVF